MENFRLRYGDGEVDLQIDGAKSVRVLEENEIEPIQDLAADFLLAVTGQCVQSPPLHALLSADDLVTIVISDITRFWMRQDKICALLLDYLHETIGIPDANIVVLIALGSHRQQTEDELRTLVSPAVFARVQVVNHDCMADDLAYFGTTTHGTEVYVNRLAAGRKVILIGGTMHHLMSGYGGGRKSILPGIAGKKTINQNHIHSLSPDRPRSNPLIGMGKLKDNPVNDDMKEAAELVSPVFGINIVVNSRNEHCRLVCGHWRAAWEESCAIVQQTMGVPIDGKSDIVIVSCGGYPKDINLYQAVKSLLNAAQALKSGGTLVFLAECREGGGAPEFFDWIEPLKHGELDAALRASFSIAGYIFYASCEAIARADVRILSRIPKQIAADMRMRAYDDIGALIADVDFTGRDVSVIPFGGYVVPLLSR